jgi:hypothetical protein
MTPHQILTPQKKKTLQMRFCEYVMVITWPDVWILCVIISLLSVFVASLVNQIFV